MLYLCYSINNFSVMEAGISMLSFLENNPGYEPEEVFFIDYGIHPVNKERLDGIAGRYGKHVTFLSGKPVTDEVRRQFPYLRPWQFTMAPNAKAFIDKIVPEYVERLLFLDADTLVMRPIEELLHLDMKGAALAAVPQCWDTASVRAGSLRLCHGGSMYFNSGVLLYDLAVWRKEDCHKMVMDTLQMKKQFYSPDQTLLNNAIPARLQYQFARENNPQYLSSRQAAVEARRDAERARVERNLSISIDASIGLNQVANRFTDAFRHLLSQDMASVTLSVPIKDWGKRKNAYLAARSTVEAALRAEQESARDTELDVALTVAEFNERQAIVQTAREALTIAEDAYAQTLQRFIKAQADAYSLSVAQSHWQTARQNQIASLQNYWLAYYHLRRLTLYDYQRRQTISH